MKNKAHIMVFQNFQILKLDMADFDLAAKSNRVGLKNHDKETSFSSLFKFSDLI